MTKSAGRRMKARVARVTKKVVAEEARSSRALLGVAIVELADARQQSPAEVLVDAVRDFVGEDVAASLERRVRDRFRGGYVLPRNASIGELGYGWGPAGITRPPEVELS